MQDKNKDENKDENKYENKYEIKDIQLSTNNRWYDVPELVLPKDYEDNSLDAMGKPISYQAIPTLRPARCKISYTEEMIREIHRCRESYKYFIENYVQMTTDNGFTFIKLRKYQEKILHAYFHEKRIVLMMGRQMSKSSTTALYILYSILFGKDLSFGIAANQQKMAVEVLTVVKESYLMLPLWMQQGVRTWNSTSIFLENKCKIKTSATTPTAFRGMTFSSHYTLKRKTGPDLILASTLAIDEVAFINTKIFNAFKKSVFPTVSAGLESKIFMFSTPNGMNHFKKIWDDAKNHKSNFKALYIHWSEHPDRDEKWKKEKIKELNNVTEWLQEFECVEGDTTITIRINKKNKNIPIRELEKLLDKIKIMYINTDEIEILTPTGFKSFDGIQKLTKYCVNIKTKNHSLICSIDHPLKTTSGIIKAKELTTNNYIMTKTGKEKITDISDAGLKDVYSILEVENHLYYTNDIISHNCNFAGSSKTLLSKTGIQNLLAQAPIRTYPPEDLLSDLKIYLEPEEGHRYITGVDTNKYMGDSYDYSSIVVLDVTSWPFKQAASWRTSNTTYLDMVPITYKIAKMYNNAHLFIENNSGDGQSLADLIYETYDYDNIYSEKDGILGFRTTTKSRRIGLNNLKKLIESDKLEIYDFEIIDELYNFILRSGKFQASKSSTDDGIFAVVAALFFMQDEELFSNDDIINIISHEDDNDEYLLDLCFFDNSAETQMVW